MNLLVLLLLMLWLLSFCFHPSDAVVVRKCDLADGVVSPRDHVRGTKQQQQSKLCLLSAERGSDVTCVWSHKEEGVQGGRVVQQHGGIKHVGLLFFHISPRSDDLFLAVTE